MTETAVPDARDGGRVRRLAADWRVQAVFGVAALGLAIAVGMALGRREPRGDARPAGHERMSEAFAIADSWRAAAAADEGAYLRCFTGEAREAEKARLARLGTEAFRKQLRAAAEAALGVEWGPPAPAPEGGLRFPVTVLHEVEAEQFDYIVARVGSDWRIRAVERRGRRAASPPYAERLGPPAGQGVNK